MKAIFSSEFHSVKSLLCLLTTFSLVMIAGCSKNDSALEALKIRNVAVTADSLVIYSSQGNLPVVELLLDAGVDVNAKNSLGTNALIEASWAGKPEVVSYLLDNGADVNSTSSGRLTALSAAISQKQEPIALLLIEQGADPNVVDNAGSTPLIEAAWLGNLILVNALLEEDANPNFKRSDDGFTALNAAGNKPDIVQALKAFRATE